MHRGPMPHPVWSQPGPSLEVGWLAGGRAGCGLAGGWRCVALAAGGLADSLASKILISRPAVEQRRPANQGRTRHRMSGGGVMRCAGRG